MQGCIDELPGWTYPVHSVHVPPSPLFLLAPAPTLAWCSRLILRSHPSFVRQPEARDTLQVPEINMWHVGVGSLWDGHVE